MEIRFYIEPETDRPHIEFHGVSTREVRQVLEQPGQDYAGYGGARVAIGQTQAGRYLKVIYTRSVRSSSLFVITAYALKGNELRAYRRRIRRQGKQGGPPA